MIGQLLLEDAARKEMRIRAIGVLIYDIELNVLEARQVEKDFLISGKLESIEQHKTNMNLVNNDLKELESVFSEKKQLESHKELKQSLISYNQNFELVVEQKILIGFDDSSGLLQKIKKSVKKSKG